MSTITRAFRAFFTLRPVRRDVSTRVAVTGTIAIVLSQILDYVTTTIGVQAGAAETNPIMAAVVHSWWIFLSIKVAATSFLCWVAWKRPVATLIVVTLYLIVGYNNLFVIAQLMR